MDRRNFIGRICKAVAIAAIAPATLASTDSGWEDLGPGSMELTGDYHQMDLPLWGYMRIDNGKEVNLHEYRMINGKLKLFRSCLTLKKESLIEIPKS